MKRMKIGARLRHLSAAITGRVAAEPGVARYAGAAYGRIVAQWFADLEDPNRELRGALSVLRARAREAIRDNGEAAGLLFDFEADIVGAQGAQLQFRATRPRGGEIKALNDRVERAFWEWSRPGTCTVGQAMSFAALQRMVIRTVIVDGEFLAIKVADPRLPHGFALQVIDPDQLDETENRPATATDRAVVLGVEVDAVGGPTRYKIWDRHPSLPGRVARWVDASDVIHVFKRLRAGQVRGVTWFAPALVTWKLGSRYTEAELYQSLLAAAQGGFFENEDSGITTPVGPDGQPVLITMEAVPGTARALPSGWTFKPWEPKHPTANYVGFMKAIKRVVARSFGRSYASTTGDLSDVNFSSIRTDRVREMQQNKVHQQELLIEQFCERVFSSWYRMAATKGILGAVALTASEQAWYTTWMCTGWPWIDPVKDATAAQMELNMGITSPQRICAERGRDYYEVIDEIAEARDYAQSKGVTLDAVPLAVQIVAGDGVESENGDAARVLPFAREKTG